jgi:abhydrolase domain-containing protein 6
MKKVALALLAFMLLAIGFVQFFPAQAFKLEFARQRVLAGAEAKMQSVDGQVWHTLEAGHGPLMVLVHGYTGSKENWLPVMRDLAKQYRVIAVDLPGWGEDSPLPGLDYSPLAQAKRLDAFLAAQDQPVAVLVGHSMGGMISGLLLSDTHRATVQRVVFMSSAGVRFNENEFARRVLKGDNPFAVYDAEAFSAFLKRYVFQNAPYVPRAMAAELVQRRARHKVFEKTVFTQMRLGKQAFLLQERLPNITQPALLLWCKGDKIIDPSAAGVFAQGLKNSKTVLLEQCGHMPMMEKPSAVSAVLAKAL